MTAIVFDQVFKLYGNNPPVLRDVNLEIADGEFCVFIGPSGCGKSTLLRMIAGLEEISQGDLFIGGQRMNNVAPARRGISMVFQSYALFPHLTVYENMAFGLQLARLPKAEIDTKVREAARVLQLEPYLARKPKELSGGQRQRVAIGRAIVRSPKAFLFDEPLSNLDTALRVQTRIEIARLHKRFSEASMVYVTHDQVEAMTLADKIAVMRSGRVEQFGTPRQLFADPDNTFVAGFIGAPKMNFVRAEVARQDGSEAIAVSPSGETVSFRTSAPLGVGRKVLLGVRPQHVELADDGPFAITADVVEAIGTETNIFGSWFGVDGFTITCSGNRAIASQDQVRFALPAASIFVFDAETGLRLR